MKVAVVQSLYGCDRCKAASDFFGRGCKHGALFPVLLVMGNQRKCPNFKYDAEKVHGLYRYKEQKRKEKENERI